MNIGKKLLVIVITSVTLGSITSIVLGYFISTNRILKSESSVLKDETNEIVAKYQIWIDSTETSLKNLSTLMTFSLSSPPSTEENHQAFERFIKKEQDHASRTPAAITSLPKASAFLPPDTPASQEEERQALRAKELLDIYGPALSKPFTNAWFFNPRGLYVVLDYLDSDLVHKIPANTDFADQPWIQLGDPQSNPERKIRWISSIVDPASKRLVISVLHPLDIHGKWVGNVGHNFTLSTILTTLFKSGQRYPNEQHFLLDDQNHYILAGPWYKKVEKSDLYFRPDLSKESELAILLRERLSGTPKAFDHSFTVKGKEYLAVGVQLEPLGWRYFRLIPVDDILTQTRETFFYLTLMLIVSSISVGAMIDASVRRSFVGRINQLSEVLHRYGEGNLKARSTISGDDEISGLASDFNEMASKLEHHLKVETNLLQREKIGMSIALDGICILDEKGRVVEANTAFCRMLGYTMDEMSSLHFSDWGTEWSIENTPDKIKQLISQESMFETVFRSKTNQLLDVEISATGMNLNDQYFLYFSSRDITDRKQAENQIKQLAFFDALTNLPNRRLLLDRINHALTSSERNKTHCALLFIDLDRFKALNDTFGHDQGDILLQHVANRLNECVRESDTVARLGGDEFVVLLEHLNGEANAAAAQAKVVGEKILSSLNMVYQLSEHEYYCSCSIGISLISEHEDTADELLKRADIAMYQAKLAGRNMLQFFDPEMQAAVLERGLLEADIRKGIENNEFTLYYQPQVIENGSRIYGAEVLVRWQHPKRGFVSPINFIPVAEETGLILPLGWWVLESACVQLTRWEQQTSFAGLSLSVNVSAHQFKSPDFVERVHQILAKTGANPRLLKLELTESAFADNPEDLIAKMSMLRMVGIKFSLDDFGTGYSSLSYLKKLPLDQLKIDQSFVKDVLVDIDDAAIVSVIIMLAHTLELDVIAEGVETEEQLQFLQSRGCKNYQGYFFGKPVPVNMLEQMVT